MKVSKQKKQKKTPFPDTDDMEDDSTSNSSRTLGGSKKQTHFYGSAFIHAVEEISQGQIVYPSPITSPIFQGGSFIFSNYTEKKYWVYLKDHLKRIRTTAKKHLQLKTETLYFDKQTNSALIKFVTWRYSKFKKGEMW